MAQADTLYLIDGSGFIFRAYYGIRAPMSAQDGTPTNAVFGFTRLLLNVIRDREPSHVAVLFDRKEPTFRHDMYPEYKANRPEPPDDLKPQFALCKAAVKHLGIPSIDMPGFEADDLIGTLATQWTAGHPTGDVVLVTADKDMMQLVNDRVSMWDGKEKTTDRAGVIDKFGVPPELVADVLGLAGDSSDNIPGVPGIGVKTAATLLQNFGGLDALLAAASTIKGKRGQNLVAFADDARLSKQLAIIKCDVPVNLSKDTLARRAPDPEPLGAFFRQLNFRRFLKEFGLDEAVNEGKQLDRSAYRTVTDGAALADTLRAIQAAGRLSFDLETTSLNTIDAQIVGIALGWAPGAAAYIPVAHEYADVPRQLNLLEVLQALKPVLEDPDFPKYGQNLKYEWQILANTTDIQLDGVVCDAMLAAYLLEPGRRVGLDALSEDLLGHKMLTFGQVTEAHQTKGQFKGVTLEAATQYAAEDADVALQVSDALTPKLKEEGLDDLLLSLEIPLARVLARMELTGILIDSALLKAQSDAYEGRLADLTDRIYELAEGPFNIDSTKQLASVLFDQLGLPSEKKTKTGHSTDAGVLAKLADLHALPALVLEYRHLRKLKNTYLDTLPGLVHPKTGRLHSSFRQAVTATGRLSSSEPNLQNIPIRTDEGRAIRQAFIPQAGWSLLSADYSQIELRLLAHCSQDEGLIQSFRDGADIHRRTAADVFNITESEVTPEQRRQAKSVNFGLMYGMSAFRLSNELKIPQSEARALIKRYFERYAGVKNYFDAAVEDARAAKKATTLLGRTRRLPHIDSKSFTLRQQSERLAINTPIQGSAADILKLAMLRVDRRLSREKAQTRMLLTVHDELVFEVAPDETKDAPRWIQEEMEAAMDLSVPLLVEVGMGAHWAEIH
ncbi:MAG: DNA polymerase I [Myxococcota bacterium]|nr:DNA polymerase I [Myxococcota bacterium]